MSIHEPHEPQSMDCTEFLARYSDYDDSLVSAPELERFRAHLAECDACARYDRVLRKGRMLARQIPAPPVRAGFLPELQDRLMEEAAGPDRSPWVGAGARTVAVAALAVAAASGGVWLAGPRAVAPAPATAAASAEPAGTRAARQPAAPSHVHPADARWEAVQPAQHPTGRRVALPPLASAEPAEWAASRVDRRVASSYSPLVTGPPAYRGARSPTTGSTFSTRMTLD